MKTLTTSILTIAMTVLLTACQNPYSDTNPDLFTEKKPIEKETFPAYSIDASSKVECEEGTVCEIRVRGNVPEPGVAIFKFKGLPDGANYDASKNAIVWLPSYDAANDPDPSKPLVIQRIYTIQVAMKSSEGSAGNAGVKKEITVLVSDKPRNFTFTGGATAEANEGKVFSYPFTVVNEDFPYGPFDVRVSGAEKSKLFEVNFSVGNASDGTLSYEVPYSYVTTTDSFDFYKKKYYKKSKVLIEVRDPRGHMKSLETTWTFWDAVKPPMPLSSTRSAPAKNLILTATSAEMQAQWYKSFIAKAQATHIEEDFSNGVLSGKNTLFVTDAALKEEGNVALIERASQSVQNLVISSSELHRLRGELKTELSGLGMYSSRSNNFCRFETMSATTAQLNATVCSRFNGGKLVVLEFDINQTLAEPANIVPLKQWMKGIL